LVYPPQNLLVFSESQPSYSQKRLVFWLSLEFQLSC